MINVIKKYISLYDEEKNEIWKNAIFVFDTNILLNLYRYTSKTRNQLFEAFNNLKNRIWLPKHVVEEFGEDRCKTISDTIKMYEGIQNQMRKLLGKVKTDLRVSENDKELKSLEKNMFKWLEKNKEENLVVTDHSNDLILSELLKIFAGKVGAGFSQEEINNIQIEGKARFEKQIPPGYKDIKKQNSNNSNMYGDLIIWKEILAFSKETKKDIIFVTDDRKADWWELDEDNNKIIGPRRELIREFNDITDKSIYMYRMDTFIERLNTLDKNIFIDDEAQCEIVSFSKFKSQKISKNEFHSYFNTLTTDKERKIAILNFEIYKKEEANNKRKNQIDTLSKKYPSKSRSLEVEKLIIRNREQLNKAKKEILKLKAQIDSITEN